MKAYTIGKKYLMYYCKGDFTGLPREVIGTDDDNMSDYFAIYYLFKQKVGNIGGECLGKIYIHKGDESNTYHFSFTDINTYLPVQDKVKIIRKITEMVIPRTKGILNVHYMGDEGVKEAAKRCGYDTTSFKFYAQYIAATLDNLLREETGND